MSNIAEQIAQAGLTGRFTIDSSCSTRVRLCRMLVPPERPGFQVGIDTAQVFLDTRLATKAASVLKGD